MTSKTIRVLIVVTAIAGLLSTPVMASGFVAGRVSSVGGVAAYGILGEVAVTDELVLTGGFDHVVLFSVFNVGARFSLGNNWGLLGKYSTMLGIGAGSVGVWGMIPAEQVEILLAGEYAIPLLPGEPGGIGVGAQLRYCPPKSSVIVLGDVMLASVGGVTYTILGGGAGVRF